VLAVPVYWATGNPYAAQNWTVWLSFVLSATGSYYLTRYLVGDRRAALIAAICFGFCPHVFGHLPHIQLLMTAGLPFSLLAFHRLADRPSSSRGVALGLAMTAQAYLCAYYAVFAMLLVGFAVLVTAAARRLWARADYWKGVAVAAGVAILLTAPLAAVYAMIQRTTGFSRSVDAAGSFAANWSSYLASSAYAHAWMLRSLPRWQDVLFPGFVATVFGVAGLFTGWREGGRRKEIASLYGAIALLAVWESFGPNAGLYRITYAVVPGFTFLRAPSRFGVVVVLALSVLTAIAVARLLTRVPRPALVAAVLALAAAGELLTPLRLMPVPQTEPAYAQLARLPRGALLELPIYSEQFAYIRTRYMLASTAHWMPLVDAYSDYIPPDFTDEAEVLSNFPDRASIDILRREGVRYALVHVRDYKGEMRNILDASLKTSAADLREIYSDDNAQLYEINAAR
jgi:hypothetical protein